MKILFFEFKLTALKAKYSNDRMERNVSFYEREEEDVINENVQPNAEKQEVPPFHKCFQLNIKLNFFFVGGSGKK